MDAVLSFRARAGVAGAALLLTALSACAPAAGEADVAPAYEVEFEQARQAASSDFERDVLADSRITRMEYQEAVDRYVQCLRDSGLDASTEMQADGMYGYSIAYPAGTREASDAETACAIGTTILIETLYGSILTNPGNEDWPQLIVDCLVRNGIVGEGYSKADLFEELDANPVFREEDPVAAECLVAPAE